MQSELRTALVFMCRRVLHPLVRMLIRFGVSAGELKAIVDSVYAHAGSEYLAAQGERPSYTRLAVITGIHRNFLPGILAVPQDEFRPRSNTQQHRAARVLSGWYDDVNFQNRMGEPAVLPLRGGPKSFDELVHRYSGGVYSRTLLSELLRVGAVRMVDSGRVRALRRTPTVGGANAESVYSAGEVAGDLMATLEYNLTTHPNEQLPVRSLALEVDARTFPLFRTQLGKRADGLLDMTESLLQAHPPRAHHHGGKTDGAPPRTMTLGAAVFAVCRDQNSPMPPPPGIPAGVLPATLTGRKPRRSGRT